LLACVNARKSAGSPALAAGGERAGVKTIAICNQKGGVGKTTIALGLASAAVSRGLRTLVIDMDSQANASDALLGDLEEAPAASSYDVLLGKRGCAPAAITDSPWGVGVIAGSLDLAGYERTNALASEQRLRAGLDNAELAEGWDLCLIDCPPSLGLLVHAALVAADAALIVTEPSLSASQGVSKVSDTVATIQEHYSPQLALAGIVVNRVVATREAKLRLEELSEALGDAVWTPTMRQRAALVEAFGAGVPIHEHRFAKREEREEILGVFDAWLERLMNGGA
jgi:chromosome partitioning protein